MTNTKKKTRKVITFDESLRKPCKKVSLEGRVPGNSLMVTLIKNYLDENKARKKINVKKIVSLKDVLNQLQNQ